MFKLSFTIAVFLYGIAAVSAASDPYDFKCVSADGKTTCHNEGLQDSLVLDEGIDLAAVSKIAKPFDLQMWMMQNMMRAKPSAFIPYVRSMKSRFNGNIFKTSTGGNLRTNEGVAAVAEYENFLRNARPVQQMKWSDGLMKACYDHVKDTGPSGATGHTGVDGSTMSTRIARYMKWERTAGENIMYTSNSPLQVLTDLAVDDGVSSRGHRRNIFQGKFAYVGIYTGPHKTYGRQTVLDYSGSYTNFNFQGPKLQIPQTYMGYKGYASPDAAAGSSPAGGNSQKKEPAKKADGSGSGAKSASAQDINGYNQGQVEAKKWTPKSSSGGGSSPAGGSTKPTGKDSWMNKNHWSCNYYTIFKAQAASKYTDILTEQKYENKLKALLKDNEGRLKKYYIADKKKYLAKCGAIYKSGCKVQGDARKKVYARGKQCYKLYNSFYYAKNNVKTTKTYIIYAQRTLKQKRGTYTYYQKQVKKYLDQCKKYSAKK